MPIDQTIRDVYIPYLARENVETRSINENEYPDINSGNIDQNFDLKLVSINVCGLKSKQACPEFINMLNNYDIIGLQETKMDDLDSFLLDGFTIHFKNRKTVTKRKSGGIAIAIRDKYSKYITIIESESKLVYWFVV